MISWIFLIIGIITQIAAIPFAYRVFRLTPFKLAKDSWSSGWLVFMIIEATIAVRRILYVYSFEGCTMPTNFFTLSENLLTLVITSGLLLFSYIKYNFFKSQKLL
jgi:hypothetical protein